jgi:hypothetical protein
MSKLFFDISEIPFSRQDRLRNITLPTFLSEQLAEEIGIHIGDGFMNITIILIEEIFGLNIPEIMLKRKAI